MVTCYDQFSQLKVNRTVNEAFSTQGGLRIKSPSKLLKKTAMDNEEEEEFASSEEEEALSRQFYENQGEETSDKGEPQPSTSLGVRRRNSSGKKPNPLISSTEKCKVCKEAAAKHIHYGSVTCFSCRAFFRRSIQNKAAKPYTCKKQGNCDVGGLKSRKSCQKCRYDRCIEAGMKASWVLSEDEKQRRFRKTREKKMKQKEQQETEQESYESMTSPGETETESKDFSAETRCRNDLPLTSERSQLIYEQQPSRFFQQDPSNPSTAVTLPLHDSSSNHPYIHTAGPRGYPGFHQYPRYYGPHIWPSSSSRPSNSYFQSNPYFQSMPMLHRLPMSSSLSMQEPNQNNQYQSSSVFRDYVRNEEENASDSDGSSNLGEVLPMTFVQEPIIKMTPEEHFQIQKLCNDHDVEYKSVPFGEELIKEMVMCSVFGAPLSPSAAKTGYQLMTRRITKVAQAFEPFLDLPYANQSALLKQNADLLVSLRGAVFFEDKKKGLEQILYSMGIDDVEIGKKLITKAIKSVGHMNRIDYKNFNSLQQIDQNNEKESRYDKLLARVGSTVSKKSEFVNILSYIVLFSSDFAGLSIDGGKVESVQHMFIHVLKRFIFSLYDEKAAVIIFSNLLSCIADLHELNYIKKHRALVPAVST